MRENDPVKRAMGILFKKKNIIIFCSILFSSIILLTIILILMTAVLPIIKGGQLLDGAANFWERLRNTVTLRCFFCTDSDVNVKKEQTFYNKVSKINSEYLNSKSWPLDISIDGILVGEDNEESILNSSRGSVIKRSSIQLDIPLLLSTTFYTHDIEGNMFDEIGDNASGDFLGKVSWYPDEGDQERIKWKKTCLSCRKVGYYYSADKTPLSASKLRQHAKHMVRRDREGICYAIGKVGDCYIWQTMEWYSYHLDIDKNDSLYTMEFDQTPYSSYRSVEEARNLPPVFITYLLAKFLPTEFEARLPEAVKDLSKNHLTYLTSRKAMKNMIYSYKKGYEYLVGNLYTGGNYPGGSCIAAGSNCTYEVKDINKQTVNVNNIKVKLLQCKDGKRGEPVPGEELIDFEKYILGVTYAETEGSSYEALKAESIAARSFALTRGQNMDAKYLKIYQENGQWILPIRSCTEDQVYCDPDKGCTVKNGGKNATGNTVYSGTIAGKEQYKGPLAADSEIRKAVAETAGNVLVDGNGKIVYADYTDKQHKEWEAGAKAGKDAYQLLAKTYGSDKTLKANCEGQSGCYTATGEWAEWKQADKTWGNIHLGSGGSSLKNAGCLATSVAKLIAMSKTKVTINNFNPGTMVEYLNKHGGFSGSNWIWSAPSSSGLAPNFKHMGMVQLSGSQQQKAAKVKEYLDQGYYIALKVRQAGIAGASSDHWVAVLGTTGNDIIISDPSSNATTAWSQYKPAGTVRFGYYKKTD